MKGKVFIPHFFNVIPGLTRNLKLLNLRDSPRSLKRGGNDSVYLGVILNKAKSLKKSGIKLIVAFFVLVASSCESDKKEKKTTPPPPVVSEPLPDVNVPAFNADSAYAFIEKQVSFGPRVPNTPPHAKAAEYLEQKLRSYNFNVTVQKAEVKAFDNTILRIKNIIAEHNPENTNRILLFAHWDTRPFADQDSQNQNKPIDGANDGGSGVGVLLEVARLIAQQPPGIGIDIIFFDGEDYGQPENTMMERKPDTYCLGSQYWAKNLHKENYKPKYGILLDMVGAADATFPKEGTSMAYAPFVVQKVWGTAQRLGYGNYFINEQAPPITDDHLYVNALANIPSIDIIHLRSNGGFGHFWHTHKDNMSIIDKTTLKAVGETVLDVIYREK